MTVDGRKRQVVVRLISAVLVVLILMPLCSCNIKNRIKEIGSDEYISTPELVRLLITAVKSENNLSDAYSQIPEQQRGGVSYSYLKEYTDILREMSKFNGPVKSFRILNEQQTDEILDDCLSGIGGAQTGHERYGDLGCAEFLYGNDNDQPVYLFFEYDKNGNAILSSSWISDTIGIYEYAKHYINMVFEIKSVEGIFTLLRPAYDPAEYSDNVVRARAQALLDYYSNNVKSTREEFIIGSLSPAEYTIIIPDTEDLNDSREYVEHVLSVTADGNGGYMVEDSIPQVIDTSLADIYFGDAKIVRCGTHYTSKSINQMPALSDPIYTMVFDGDTKYAMFFPGMSLWFDIESYDYDDGDDYAKWSGWLVEVRLYGEDGGFSSGSGIKVGINIDDILTIYPFLDDVGIITYDTGERDISLSYEYDDDGTITSVRIYDDDISR